MINPDSARDLILAAVNDLAEALLYNDRRDDEELPRGAIENAIKEGVLSIDDIVNEFKTGLYDHLAM